MNHLSNCTSVALRALTVSALIILATSTGRAIEWSRSTVTSGTDIAATKAVAVDHGGRVHVVYTFPNTDGGIGLRHAVQDQPGGTWQSETVEGASGTASRSQLSLAADHEGTLHLSYVFELGDIGSLFYRSKLYVNDWDPPTGIGQRASLDSKARTSIDLHADGRPAIAYTGEDATLNYASLQLNGTWTTEEANGTADSGFYPSLALNGTLLHPISIAHHDANGEDLRLTQLRNNLIGPASWETTDIQTSGITGMWASLQRKPDLGLAVAYVERDGLDTILRYAESFASVFFRQDVAYATNHVVGYDVTLRMDPAGHPVLAYPDAGTAGGRPEIFMARRIPGGGWDISSVLRPNSGTSVGVAMDTNGSGAPIIAYDINPGGTPAVLDVSRPSFPSWTFSSTDQPGLSTIAETYAVSMATDPRGGKHLCCYAQPTSGVGALRYVDMSSELPVEYSILSQPFVSSAMSVDAQDAVHVVVLRETTPPSIVYRRLVNGSLDAVGAIDFGDPAADPIADQELQMASAPDGNQHLVYQRSDGGVGYGFLRAGNTIWSISSLSTNNLTLLSLAISEHGKVGVCGYELGIGRILFFEGRGLGSAFTRNVVRALAKGVPDPLSTSLAYAGESPRIAYAPGNEVVVSEAVIFPDFFHRSLHTLPGPGSVEVKMIAGCANLQLVYTYPYDDAATVSPIGYILHDYDAATTHHYEVAAPVGVRTPRLNLAVDRGLGGLVQAAFTLQDPDDPETRRVIVARPADSMDNDGDGIPLVAENAHVLDPTAPDGISGARSRASVTSSGDVFATVIFRHPAMGGTTETPTRFDIGEFTYQSHYSTSLKCFRNSPPSGVSPSVRDTTVFSLGVSETDVAYTFGAAFIQTHPKAFMRLSVRRRTPEMP